ncbi:jg11086 [Pararge aegeria aegeria]|uniref:Jg11086 protein n=1 Tax=Pararge aegeria aegeria TaxID=348720 RepID=A0A8S4R928_9NEOP|nr:jg11086 [Pararge aegeria aegeria]
MPVPRMKPQYLLNVVGDEHDVDAADAQLVHHQEHVHGQRGRPRGARPHTNTSPQIQSWSCSLGLVLAFLQDQDQEQDRVFLARPRPRLTVQDLSKNKT